MKSKASIKGHPLHQMLVGFPIAFLVGTLFFDVLALLRPDSDFRTTASYLNIGGIITGLLAAIPGIMDYGYTVPPQSSAKKRAVKHGLANASVIILFSAAYILRPGAGHDTVIVVIETIGAALLAIAGWLGGTLVVRNQIGVDIRYAGAGRWTEIRIDTTEKVIPVAAADELKPNQMKLVHLNGNRIVLAKIDDDNYSAFDDRCSHRGGSLAAGALICRTVQCPWHGSQFDVLSGGVLAGPAKNGVAVYKTSVKDNAVYLHLS
jgi:nitrite reductase/ring-hydroxylating ferredoxin subunit/uncharacterized membrane protein